MIGLKFTKNVLSWYNERCLQDECLPGNKQCVEEKIFKCSRTAVCQLPSDVYKDIEKLW